MYRPCPNARGCYILSYSQAPRLLPPSRVEIDEKQLPEMLQQALAAARKRGALEDDDDGDAEESEEDPMAGEARCRAAVMFGTMIAGLWTSVCIAQQAVHRGKAQLVVNTRPCSIAVSIDQAVM